MGNCILTPGMALPASEDYDDKNSDGGENFYDEIVNGIDVDYFKVAVQNCVSVSIGVASRNVVVYNVVKSPLLSGIDVTYSVSDVYGRTTAKDIRKHIDRSITSGKFTSLLHQHGFLTAEAKDLIRMPDAVKPKKSVSEEAVTRVLLVHITQTFTGVDIPSPKRIVEKSPTGFQNLITNARRSINPNKPLAACSTPSQGDVQVTATVAAELDYTTPAFKTALQQSVANAAGVPPEAVTIFEIKPSPSGSDLEILYSVDGLSPTDTVSDFKARIDKAVASGWFTSSLQGDGYFGVSAKAPTAVIRLAFTMKQKISLVKKTKKSSNSEETVRTETDERTPIATSKSSRSTGSKSRKKSGRPDSAASSITKETRPNSNETIRTSETKQEACEPAVMNALRGDAAGNITRQSTMDEIPEEEPPTILESMVSENSAPTTPLRATTPLRQRDSAPQEATQSQLSRTLSGCDYVQPEGEITMMSEVANKARRNSMMWSSTHEDRVLRAQEPAAVVVQQPLSPGSKDVIPEASVDLINDSGTPAEEVKAAERSLTPPHLRYHAAMTREEADIVEEERRLLGLKSDVSRVKREEECYTQLETDERLQRIEDLHRLREIEKQAAACEAKTKEEEVFRIKREEGRAIALAAELRRGSTMETRKIRLEDSKNAFEVVKMKTAKYGAGLDAATVAADRADEMHRRSSLQVPKKKQDNSENRRASVGDTARTKLRKKPLAQLDTEDAFDLAPITLSPKKSSPKKSSQSSPKILSAYDSFISGSDDGACLLPKDLPKSPTEQAWGASMWQTLSSLSTGRREGEQ